MNNSFITTRTRAIFQHYYFFCVLSRVEGNFKQMFCDILEEDGNTICLGRRKKRVTQNLTGANTTTIPSRVVYVLEKGVRQDEFKPI